MAAEPFNSLGGFTVGIPPVSIVDESGNIITNATGRNTLSILLYLFSEMENGIYLKEVVIKGKPLKIALLEK